MSTYDRSEENAKEPQTMSQTDVKDYDGLTLNEDGEKVNPQGENPYIRIKMIHADEWPWWKKAAGILGVVAFFAVGLVVAWFFFLWGIVILAIGGMFYFLKRYF